MYFVLVLAQYAVLTDSSLLMELKAWLAENLSRMLQVHLDLAHI